LTGVTVNVNPGYLYSKFNSTKFWNFFASNYNKYGLEMMKQNAAHLHMLSVNDYSIIPYFQNFGPENRPLIFFILHNDDENSGLMMIPDSEKKFYLDEVFSLINYLNFTVKSDNRIPTDLLLYGL